MEEMMGHNTDYNMDHLYDAFLKLADKKKGQVFDYDLEALAFINKQQEELEHFRLIFSVQSGPAISQIASVKLACGDETKPRPPTVTARWTPFIRP